MNSILPPNHTYDYLRANEYITDFSLSQGLLSALKLGVIDLLASHSSVTPHSIVESCGLDEKGCDFQLALLARNGVIERTDIEIWLTEEFRSVLPYLDYLETQIEFANHVAPDVMANLPYLLQSERAFMERAELFQLFDYSKAIEITPDNINATKRWMKYTTNLTRYEAPVFCSHFDFTGLEKVMDIGGNSGELVLQICKQNPNVHATVVDLPVVCEVGKQHVAPHPERNRIQFYPANALFDPLPGDMDLVVFKSVLHDWPDEAVMQLLKQAKKSLKPGGKLVIFERSRIAEGPRFSFYQWPLLLFFRSYRSGEKYLKMLRQLKSEAKSVQILDIDTGFLLMTNKLLKY